jgi:osmoprotectant transport system substrate-binding protein
MIRFFSLLRGRALGCALLLLALSAQAAAPIRVGSKIDTEGALLGNMILQVLQAHGVPTQNNLSLGNTKVVRTAITSGAIDIYPEYTGNGAFFFSDEKNPDWKRAERAYMLVRMLDFAQNRIVWLTPAPANNTWTIAVRADLANRNHLQSMSDLGRWLKRGGSFKLAASAEFIERNDALPAFERIYGFKLKQDQLLTLAGGNTALTLRAAAQQMSGVNAAMSYGTDGQLAALGMVALRDDKGAQPVYAPAPIIRADALKQYPHIGDWLAPVFRSLDGPTLQMLNARIAVEGKDARKVAADYLKLKGFIR